MTLVLCVSRRYPRLHLAVLACLLLGTLAVSAADNNPPDAAGGTAEAASGTTPSLAPAGPAKQCYNGCQRWGQMCNVDPRGVYKCQRRCEKFGEICE